MVDLCAGPDTRDTGFCPVRALSGHIPVHRPCGADGGHAGGRSLRDRVFPDPVLAAHAVGVTQPGIPAAQSGHPAAVDIPPAGGQQPAGGAILAGWRAPRGPRGKGALADLRRRRCGGTDRCRNCQRAPVRSGGLRRRRSGQGRTQHQRCHGVPAAQDPGFGGAQRGERHPAGTAQRNPRPAQ